MMRTSLLRATRAATPSARLAMVQKASVSTAISNPTLANIEKRWEGMPNTEQAELWMALRDRMKENWAELTVQEKKAAYWIAFGPHGPRSQPPADENRKVLLYTFLGVAASFAMFVGIRLFARPPPHTMTQEYQQATDEFLIRQKSSPLTGIASESGAGVSFVVSPPKKD